MGIFLAFLSCVLIWGSTWYAIELQLGVVPKEWSLFYRFGIAAIALFAICLVRGDNLKLPARSHIFTGGTGLFLFSGSYVLTYSGTEYLTSGLVAVIFSLLSFLNIVNGRLFLGNKIQPSALASALLGIAGLVLIFEPEIQAFSFQDDAVIGLFYCVAATVVCSIGNTFAGAPTSKSLPLFSFNAYGLGYGALFNLLFALVSGAAPTFDARLPYVGSLFYLAILGTVVAFTIYIWLINKVGVGRAAYVSVMMPVVALTISTFLEGFKWSPEALFGLAFVLAGNVLMIRTRTPVPAPPAAEAAAEA